MGQNKCFAAVLPYKNRFYKRYKAGCSGKYPNHENLLHHCCEHCQVNNNVRVTEVFTNNFICSFKLSPFETSMYM